MKDTFFNYSAKTNSKDVVDIHIFGIIGLNEKWYGDGTNNKAYALVSLIKRLDKEYARINVHINSPGGSIADGLAIYNALKACKAEIHTYNAGLVGSMASIIMLAGTTHFPKTSIYHLHAALTVTEGNIRDHQKSIESLEVFESTLKTAIANRTGLTVEEVHAKWFDGSDYFMNGETAHELGFVDELEDLAAEPPVEENQLKNMSYPQIMNLYQTEEEKPKKGFLDSVKEGAKSLLNITNNSNNSNNSKNLDTMSNPLKIKAKLTVLLAVFGLQEFVLNATNKIEMEIDDAYAINDALEEKDRQIIALTEEKAAFDEKLTAKDTEIANLKAKLEDKPLENGVNPKGGDNYTGGTADTEWNDDASAKLKEYNKKNGSTDY